MTNATITAYLKEHPRMMGVLFTTALLLTQAGSGAAAAVYCHGP